MLPLAIDFDSIAFNEANQKRPTMLKVIDVSHHYGVRPVLSHINFEVPTGELVVLMGPNGVGKSTLLGIIAGLMAPAKGCVEVNGLRRRSSEEAELQIRRQMAYLADQPWLPEFKTGREWLMAVGQLYDLDPERLMEHISRLFELFQLADKGDAPIRTFSNGQKKKLALCGVLVTEAPILVLDEPFTGGLDAAAVLALSRVLKHLAERDDTTILMASQIGEMVEPLADRIAVLEGARLKAYDTLDGLRAQTGCSGSLSEVFERLVHPQTLEQIEQYFLRPKP
jgi:ABC-2 type transport system ATP-binding protein